MEQSIKRLEDLPGYRIEGADKHHGCVYLSLEGDRHVVFGVVGDEMREPVVDLIEPDVIWLARIGYITEEQLLYELREEIEGRNWERVRELSRALERSEQ